MRSCGSEDGGVDAPLAELSESELAEGDKTCAGSGVGDLGATAGLIDLPLPKILPPPRVLLDIIDGRDSHGS